MSGDELWEIFCETGEPLCWLWSRLAEDDTKDDENAPAAE